LARESAIDLSPEVEEASDFWIDTFLSAYYRFADRAEVSIKFPPTEKVLVEVIDKSGRAKAARIASLKERLAHAEEHMAHNAATVGEEWPIYVDIMVSTV
jgi:hypothetical protein